MSIVALGLGTSALGGMFEASNDVSARASIDRAWELGVRYFDTAPLYGSGLAEHRLGAALRDRPRKEFALYTKVGRLLVPGGPDPLFKGAPPLGPVFDFSRTGLRRSLEESLARLSLDRVDLVLIHDPDDHLDEAFAALDSLRDLTLLPLCAKRTVTVIAAGVFNSGLLAGGATFDYQPASRAPDRAHPRTRCDMRTLRGSSVGTSDPVSPPAPGDFERGRRRSLCGRDRAQRRDALAADPRRTVARATRCPSHRARSAAQLTPVF